MNKEQETELLQAMLDWFTAHDVHAERMAFSVLAGGGKPTEEMTTKKRALLKTTTESRAALNAVEDKIDGLCDRFGVDIDERNRLMDQVDAGRVRPVSQTDPMILEATRAMYERLGSGGAER